LTAASQRGFSTIGPAIRMRGPSSDPAAMLSRHALASAKRSAPMSRMPVTPCARYSLSEVGPNITACECKSHMPGMRYVPDPFTVAAPRGTRTRNAGPTAVIRLPEIRTVRFDFVSPVTTLMTATSVMASVLAV
jgi:hypothetical protein